MPQESGTVARLKALTPEAEYAIHGPQVVLDAFPFRVGRESRRGAAEALLSGGERRRGSAPPNNELYLSEQTREVFVSREHFEIQHDGSRFHLVDRKSALGTWVEGELLGGNRRGGSAPLSHGDVIIVASFHSGLIYKFEISGT